MRTAGESTSAAEPGEEAGQRDPLADFPDELSRPRGESLFTIIDHGRPRPLVFPPAPPRQRQPDSTLKRLIKRGDSLAIASVVLVYAVVVWMTFSIAFAQRDAQRRAAAAAAEASVDVSPPETEAR